MTVKFVGEPSNSDAYSVVSFGYPPYFLLNTTDHIRGNAQ